MLIFFGKCGCDDWNSTSHSMFLRIKATGDRIVGVPGKFVRSETIYGLSIIWTVFLKYENKLFHIWPHHMACWKRQWQPTPVFMPGESQGQGSLVGCSPWGPYELDTNEWLHFHFSLFLHWRRKWHPIPVFLPGESQGRGSLVGCRLWGRTESDMT